MAFPDVPEDHYSAPAIEELVKRGIFKGRDDGTFGLGRPLQRQDAAVLLWRLIRDGYMVDQWQEEPPPPPPPPPPSDFDRIVDSVAGFSEARSGERIFVKAGVYQAGVVSPDFTTWVFEPGAKLDGNGGPHAFSGDARDVVIEGGEFFNFDPPTQHGVIESTARRDLDGGWKVRNVWLHDNDEVGVRIGGHNTELINSIIEDQGRLGFALQYGDGGQAIGNTILRCNADNRYSAGFEAGGSKCWKTSNLLIQDNVSRGHGGPGLWTDKDNVNTIYRGNLVEDCPGAAAGIFHEISFDAIIEDNVVRNCGEANWGYGAGILASTSDGVVVRQNRVENCGNGIFVLSQTRGSSSRIGRPYYGRNFEAYNNVVVNSGHSGAVRADQGFPDIWNAEFTGNSYDNCEGFAWDNRWIGWNTWQDYGQDAGGSWR